MFKFTIGSTITSLIVAGSLWGATGVLAAVTLVVVGFTTYAYRRHARVSVGEMEVGVVYTQDGKNFVRFLSAGDHWLDPFNEQLLDVIPVGGQSVRGKSSEVQTIGGLPLSVDWTAHYSLQPLRLDSAVGAKMARALPHKAGAIAQQHINNIIHHVIGEYKIDELGAPAIHRTLERQVRQQAMARLEALGFKVSRVMIDAIHKPKEVMAALEAAHKREVQAEHEARALERLQKVVSQFSEADMQRLMELERIHTLGRNGVTMVYPHMNEAGNGRASGFQRTVVLDPLS